MPTTVAVPSDVAAAFARAEKDVGAYFELLHRAPEQGTITVDEQRYVLVRAAAMSVEFYETITHLYRDKGEEEARAVARSLLYDLAYAIGTADARAFHRQLGLTDSIEKLSAGPVHFAHTGWASVRILPESRPTADESYLLVYDHPYSFEADAWLAAGRAAHAPACTMNAGYSAGWCAESFGVPLVAVEISCRAAGDAQCRFVMATPERLEVAISDYLRRVPELTHGAATYEIPGFFSRKRIEDELREREQQYRSIFESASDAMLIVELSGRIAAANPAACALFGYELAALLAREVSDLAPPDQQARLDQIRIGALAGRTFDAETLGRAADGHLFEAEVHISTFMHRRQPHLLVLARDISGRKRAEAERLHMQADLRRQHEQMRADLMLARVVQAGLLPSVPPWDTTRLTVASRARSAGEVSGYFYSYVALDTQRMGIVLGDISGKGVAAALMIALLAGTVEQQFPQHPSPAALLAAVDARVAAQLQQCGMFASLLVAVIDLHQQRLGVANAGGVPPVLLRDRHAQMLDAGGLPLGLIGAEYIEASCTLLPGDRLVLLSDGIAEARSPHGEIWGYERLLAALCAAPLAASAEEIIDTLLDHLGAFTQSAPHHDDITVVVAQPRVELR